MRALFTIMFSWKWGGVGIIHFAIHSLGTKMHGIDAADWAKLDSIASCSAMSYDHNYDNNYILVEGALRN